MNKINSTAWVICFMVLGIIVSEMTNQNNYQSNLTKFSKPRTLLDSELQYAASNSNGAFELAGEISANRDLSNLKYKWILPDGVELSEGFSEGDVGNIQLGENKKLKQNFVITQGSSTPRTIQLVVYQIVNGETMGDSSYFILEDIKPKAAQENFSIIGALKSIGSSNNSREPASVNLPPTNLVQ